MIDFGIFNRIVTPITPHHCWKGWLNLSTHGFLTKQGILFWEWKNKTNNPIINGSIDLHRQAEVGTKE